MMQSLKLTSDRPPDPGKFCLGLVKDQSYLTLNTGKHYISIMLFLLICHGEEMLMPSGICSEYYWSVFNAHKMMTDLF
jgi:hypothetical protein